MSNIKEINYLAKLLARHVRNDWDSLIIITGIEGSGKSILCLLLGMTTDEKFDMENNIIWTPDEYEITQAIRKLPKYSYIALDEAIKAVNKYEWHQQINFYKFLKLCREENKIIVLVSPNINDLNKSIRQERVHLWIHVTDRRFATVFIRDETPGKPFWNLKLHIKSLENKLGRLNYTIDLNTEEKLEILQRSPHFLFHIEIPLADKELIKKYKKLKSEHQYELLARQEGFSTIHRKQGYAIGALSSILHLNFDVMQKDIAKLTGFAPRSIGRYVERFTENVISDTKTEAINDIITKISDKVKKKDEIPEIPKD